MTNMKHLSIAYNNMIIDTGIMNLTKITKHGLSKLTKLTRLYVDDTATSEIMIHSEKMQYLVERKQAYF